MNRYSLWAAPAALLLAIAQQPAIAAERLGRLTVEVKVIGREEWRNAQRTDHATVKRTADYTGDVNERMILCAGTQLVVDPKQKRVYTDGITIGSPKGTSVRTNGGRTSQWQGELPLKGEPFQWASEQLRRAPLSGTRKAVVKITNANGSSVPFAATQGGGTAEVELSWCFEELR